ncbi:hypothetical protein [Paraburkholderia sp. JHI869]|uniref:hypothetical protein n=1 Tax=Paraburkholderia sp. JHI869 TaxID=3112959 RepID=UPI00317D6492
MRKIERFATICVMVAGAAIASPSFAQTVWHNTKFGMSVKQVQAAVPEAVPNPEAGHGTIQTALLRVNDVEMAGHKLKAFLYFHDYHLAEVDFELKTDGGDDAARAFDDITKALRLKYGKESTMNVDPSGTGGQGWWSAKPTNISLFYAKYPPDPAGVLTIQYLEP